jgi:hypothetical protein
MFIFTLKALDLNFQANCTGLGGGTGDLNRDVEGEADARVKKQTDMGLAHRVGIKNG